jgi:hypothetical protein
MGGFEMKRTLVKMILNCSRLFLCLIIGLLLMGAMVGNAQEEATVPYTLFDIEPHGYSSSEVCARCHGDIYADWKTSMHAQSLDDPIFQVALLQAQVDHGEKIREYCLFCHAPLVQYTKDFFLRDPVTREGVTCDFCHTITAARPGDREKPYDLQPGLIKRGPFKDVTSPAHETMSSDIHLRSEFCGGCHELINANGVRVMGTYTEWKEGPYPAEDVHCQNCHMPMTFEKKVVEPKVKKSTNFVTAHEFRGGHSQINLRHAATVDLEVIREGRTARVTTYVTNAESGHKLPTGTPARRVVLLVTATDEEGNIVAKTRRVYRKVLVDKDGVILEDNADLILRSVAIYQDNRISPKETRKEEFVLDLPPDAKEIHIEAELKYEFETPVMYTQKMEVEMAKDTEILKIR